MLIGLSGKASSGKDTVGSILVGQGFHRFAFADKVRKIARDLFNLSDEQLLDPVLKEEFDPRWSATPRQIMQGIGVGMRKIHKQVWTRYVLSEVDLFDNIVITDVRFPDEAAQVKTMGGFLVRIVRPGAESKSGANDESEMALDDYKKWDHVICNDKDLPYLETQTKAMLRAAREAAALQAE